MIIAKHPDTYHARRIWPVIILIVSALHVMNAAAAEPGVQLVISSEQSIYRSTALLIQRQLLDKYQLPADVIDDLSQINPDSNGQLILVAIGSEAASRLALQPGIAPTLATLIPQTVIEDLGRQRTIIADQKPLRPFYALQIDQPPQRTLTLIDIALPNLDSVAVLLGPSSQQYSTQLNAAAQRLDIQLRTSVLRDEANIIREAEGLLIGSDVLLAMPDPLIYNRQTTQNLLLYTFRKHIPVIGYSQSFVKAGALMGIFSTPEQIAEQTADLVEQYRRRGTLPAVSTPVYLSLAVNRHVARSFGLVLESDEALLNKLITRLGLRRDN